jgi:hypothetical protein
VGTGTLRTPTSEASTGHTGQDGSKRSPLKSASSLPTANATEPPENPYPTAAARSATPLAELTEPVVLIVGESGIGKTQTLRAEARRLQGSGRPAVFVDITGLDAHQVGDDLAAELNRAGPDGEVLADGLDQTAGPLQSVAHAVRKALERPPRSPSAAPLLGGHRLGMACDNQACVTG